jgi:CubicO group peptidase (beta-lactamase class C family)
MKLFFLVLAAAHPLVAITQWPVATPESAGMEPSRMQAFARTLAEHNTRALLVARHGRIVFEWYAPDSAPEKKQGTASLAKALVGGLPLLVALGDGRIHLDDPAAKYIPEWRDDPQKRLITIRQLATHSSGLDDAEDPNYDHMSIPGWKGAFWRRKPDPISIALRDTPVIRSPGSAFGYSNPGMAALGYAVTASMRGTATPDIQSILRDRICRPMSIPDEDWSISYGESYMIDGLRVYATWGGAAFTPRATARLGQLLLQHGKWEGRQLIKDEWAREAVRYAGTPIPSRTEELERPASGIAWYVNYDGVWKNIPRDAFSGAGAGQEAILVIPSLDLIIVRNGGDMSPRTGNRFWVDLEEYIFQPVVDALRYGTSKPPYPPSPVIAQINFAPAGEIQRQAIDSDNWPMTWGDDDVIYTSYGDGEGFEPFIDHKLSMGVAKVTGMPPSFVGENLRSDSIERTGDGRKGPKASGIIMVGKVLYMWVRNTGNSQLVWSDDHGKTWHWDFKWKEGLGSPAFLNFGRNNTGARDNYVYTYSQDGPTAYESSDRIVLARVPKDRLRDRNSYEFLLEVMDGKPVWTSKLEDRGTAFSFPGHCQRLDAVYDPGIQRYLLAVSYSHGGAWGIYDAPEPWGPWTTAFHTEDWGLGGTHGYRFTSKWIGADGLSGWLVFSGVKLPNITYDAFCVRRMNLVKR